MSTSTLSTALTAARAYAALHITGVAPPSEDRIDFGYYVPLNHRTGAAQHDGVEDVLARA